MTTRIHKGRWVQRGRQERNVSGREKVTGGTRLSPCLKIKSSRMNRFKSLEVGKRKRKLTSPKMAINYK